MSSVRSGSAAVGSDLPPADADRIAADIEALRQRTLPDRHYTRRAFTPIYAEGRQWLSAAMADAGLRAGIDAAGNLIGRSTQTPGECVAIGSHIDTVPDGGAYDGVAGVVAGLEIARLIRRAAIDLPFALEVIDFLSEEPSDFGLSCIGSRAMEGTLSGEDLARRDPRGISLGEAIRAVGGQPDALGAPLRNPGSMRAYLELHIEQGPVLERAHAPMGIVTGIVGIRRYEVRLTGAATHAGTTPMDDRRDALAGAAELVLAVERLARGRDDLVGTVGRLAVEPNASNVVPGEATATIGLRAMSETALDEAQSELEVRAEELASGRGLGLTFRELSRTPSIELDSGLRTMPARAARARGLKAVELPSGGGHDAGHVAALGPAAMVFVPCRAGLSHSPEESADPRDIALGADVMMRVVLDLAQQR